MEEDHEPFISSSSYESRYNRSRARHFTHFLWGGLFVLLLILISLVGWQITLTRDLSKKVDVPTAAASGPSSNDYPDLRQLIVSSMDYSADPCQDFYQYSCGGAISNIKLAPGQGSYTPMFSNITAANQQILIEMAKGQWPLINDLFTSCMATPERRASDAAGTLLELINKVQQDLTDNSPSTLFPLLASLHRRGVDAFFTPSSGPNSYQANSKIYLGLGEAGITLPRRSYDSAASLAGLNKNITTAVGAIAPTYTTANATNAVNVEKGIASIYTDGGGRGGQGGGNVTWANFTTSTKLDYNLYASKLGLKMADTDVIMTNPFGYFINLTIILSSFSRDELRDYLQWRVVHSYAKYPIQGTSLTLNENENLRKSAVPGSFYNTEEIDLESSATFDPQELSCLRLVNQLLGDFFGLLFTLKVLDDNIIEAIRTVTGNVQNSFRNSLPALTWIDQYSRDGAAYKLSNIIQIIGHPNKLERYRGLQTDPAHFLANIIDITARVFDDQMAQVGKPFNRADYEFDSTVVNAFYSPNTNTINFPAGILESPMFSTSFPTILQYARMGYIIGHETVHAFDNSGRNWNAFGVYSPIMDAASNTAFNQQAQCIVDQFNKFEPVPGHFVSGQRTLGENIADLGGVKNAYKAYTAWTVANGTADLQMSAKSPVVPALTNSQLFFVMMGQTWCSKSTDNALINQIATDPHAPARYRVNGPLANFDSFSSAFSCAAGTPMNPTNKCNLW